MTRARLAQALPVLAASVALLAPAAAQAAPRLSMHQAAEAANRYAQQQLFTISWDAPPVLTIPWVKSWACCRETPAAVTCAYRIIASTDKAVRHVVWVRHGQADVRLVDHRFKVHEKRYTRTRYDGAGTLK